MGRQRRHIRRSKYGIPFVAGRKPEWLIRTEKKPLAYTIAYRRYGKPFWELSREQQAYISVALEAHEKGREPTFEDVKEVARRAKLKLIE
jgi:hypothetical protein